MSMKLILGISLALVMLIGLVPLGYSDPLRDQLEQGIETNELHCDNTSHVLVLRPNGNLSCVTERAAEKLEWEIIKTSFYSSINVIKPIVTLDVPRNVIVGETFNVDYTIHWVNENGKLLYPEITLEEKSELSVKPYIKYPDEFKGGMGK